MTRQPLSVTTTSSSMRAAEKPSCTPHLNPLPQGERKELKANLTNSKNSMNSINSLNSSIVAWLEALGFSFSLGIKDNQVLRLDFLCQMAVSAMILFRVRSPGMPFGAGNVLRLKAVFAINAPQLHRLNTDNLNLRLPILGL